MANNSSVKIYLRNNLTDIYGGNMRNYRIKYVIFFIIIMMEISVGSLYLISNGGYLDSSQEIGQVPIGEIIEGIKIEQEFICTENNFAGVEIFFATYQRENKTDMIIEIKKDNEIIYKSRFNSKDIKDNQYKIFECTPISESLGKKYTFVIYSIDAQPGNALTIWASKDDIYKDGSLIINKEKRQQDLKFRTYYSRPNYLLYHDMLMKLPINSQLIYIMIIILAMLINIMLYILLN